MRSSSVFYLLLLLLLLFSVGKMRTVLLTLVALLLVTGLRSEGEAEWKKRHEWARQFWGTFKITPSKPVGPDGSGNVTVIFQPSGYRQFYVRCSIRT